MSAAELVFLAKKGMQSAVAWSENWQSMFFAMADFVDTQTVADW